LPRQVGNHSVLKSDVKGFIDQHREIKNEKESRKMK